MYPPRQTSTGHDHGAEATNCFTAKDKDPNMIWYINVEARSLYNYFIRMTNYTVRSSLPVRSIESLRLHMYVCMDNRTLHHVPVFQPSTSSKKSNQSLPFSNQPPTLIGTWLSEINSYRETPPSNQSQWQSSIRFSLVSQILHATQWTAIILTPEVSSKELISLTRIHLTNKLEKQLIVARHMDFRVNDLALQCIPSPISPLNLLPWLGQIRPRRVCSKINVQDKTINLSKKAGVSD